MRAAPSSCRETTSVGCSLLELLGQRPWRTRDGVVRGRRARSGRTPACPSSRCVFGSRSARRPRAASRSSSATSQHSTIVAGGPGSRSNTSRSARLGGAASVDPPLRHVQLERGEVGRPDQRGQLVDDDVVDRLAVHRRCPARAASPCAPSRGAARGVLLEEGRPVDAVRVALAGQRPAGEVRQQHRRDRGRSSRSPRLW